MQFQISKFIKKAVHFCFLTWTRQQQKLLETADATLMFRHIVENNSKPIGGYEVVSIQL